MSKRATARVLLVFADGVGLGEPDPARNAFAAAALPTFSRLLDGRTLTADNAPFTGHFASLVALDATFGRPGLPQSGTGHAALFTGHDAVAMFGRHFGPWVPTPLRPLVREQSLLVRAKNAGRTVAFANAYPEEVVEPAKHPDARLPRFLRAGPPLAALGADILNRHTDALRSGDAVASEITNDGWRRHLKRDVPSISAADAGHNLARIAHAHDLTLFAHYSTDTAGHRRDLHDAIDAARVFDAFLGGLLDALASDVLVVVASDHGNLEDCTAGHTRNPAVGLVMGAGHAMLVRGWTSLTDVTPAILAVLGL